MSHAFAVDSWVLWHETVGGRTMPRIGRVVRLLPQGQVIGDPDEGFDTSLLTAPNPLDMLQDSYVVAAPNPAGAQEFLLWKQRGLFSLEQFQVEQHLKATALDQKALGKRMQIRSGGSPAATEVLLDGRRLSHLTKITVNIDADRADEVTVTLRGYGPTLELSGTILTLRPEA
jgi:hypothetical protein